MYVCGCVMQYGTLIHFHACQWSRGYTSRTAVPSPNQTNHKGLSSLQISIWYIHPMARTCKQSQDCGKRSCFTENLMQCSFQQWLTRKPSVVGGLGAGQAGVDWVPGQGHMHAHRWSCNQARVPQILIAHLQTIGNFWSPGCKGNGGSLPAGGSLVYWEE